MISLADISFYKFLAEMSGTKREMFHFTNIAGLAGILKDGYIKAGEYDVNLKTEREVSQGRTSEDRKGNPELAVVRPSMAHRKNVESLSERTGLVKIIIKTHILSDKMKGVKIRPIAEYPTWGTEDLQYTFLDQDYTDVEAKLAARKVIKKMAELKDKNASNKDFEDWLKKNFKWKEDPPPFKAIEKAAGEATHYSRRREGEERIELKKSDRIPLNSVYMKVELEPGFVQDFIEGYLEQTDFEGQEILQVTQWNRWMTKWNNVFIENAELKNFKAKLTELSKEYGHRVAQIKPPSKIKKVIVKPLSQEKKEALIKAQKQGVRFVKGGPEKPFITPKLKDIK